MSEKTSNPENLSQVRLASGQIGNHSLRNESIKFPHIRRWIIGFPVSCMVGGALLQL